MSRFSHEDAVCALADALGICREYSDNWGNKRTANLDVLVRIVEAFGFPCANPADANMSLSSLMVSHWNTPLDPAYAFRAAADFTCEGSVPVRIPAGVTRVLMDIVGEGSEATMDVSVAQMPLARSDIWNGREYNTRLLALPNLSAGYHDLHVTLWGGTGSSFPANAASARILASPRYCYTPPQIRDGHKLFGVNTLLAGTRSLQNWGRGHLGDAEELMRICAQWGAGFVGFGPMTSIEPNGQGLQGPFNSNSRVASNLRVLDLAAEVKRLNLQDCARSLLEEGLVQRLEQLRASRVIDYAEVDRLILHQLEKMWEEFRIRHLANATADARTFNSAVEDRGSVLTLYATYAALRERFMASEEIRDGWHWRNWPQPFQTPTSSGVIAFQHTERERIRFYEFVEWLTQSALLRLRAVAKDLRMPIGPYLTLGFASSPGGADSWIYSGLHLPGVRLGVPGDAFDRDGQDWGNPVINPHELCRRGVQPMIDLVGYWCRVAGALEMDHGPGLARQFVSPSGFPINDGVYVKQPLELFLAVLGIESHRHETVMIAETLGTVAEGLTATLAERRVFSYHVQRWERDNNQMKRPKDFPEHGCAISSGFNMEPLRGFWLGWYPLWRRIHCPGDSAEKTSEIAAGREEERQLLLELLLSEELIDPAQAAELLALVPQFPGPVDEGSLAGLEDIQIPEYFLTAVERCLARANSILVAVDLAEVCGATEMQNIPSTDLDLRPNWLVKDVVALESLEGDEHLMRLFQAIAEERSR